MSIATADPPNPEELDHKIDEALDRAGLFAGFWARVGILVTLLSLLLWVPFFSPWANTLRDPTLTILMFVFQIMFAMMFMVVQFAALFWFLGRTRVYWLLPGETGVTFKDYRGNPEVLEVASRVTRLLRGVKHFRNMGGEVHRGLLLIGPPGTGKSYLAQCIASEAGVPFCYASAPSFQNMFMGMSNMKVMMLYNKARKLARRYGACIIFIDEIDAIGASRTSGGGAGGMMMGGMMGMGGGSGLLNELLLQMDPPRADDGWKAKMLRNMGLRAKGAERPAVLTMGATNIAQVLDAALLRPGRFDWKITIDAPDFDGRKDIFEYYLAKVAHDPNLPLEKMAHETIGYTPVSIKYVVNESVVVAHFDGREFMEYKDFVMARDMYEWGLRQPIKSMSMEDRRRIAYHETGHAIAQAKLLPKEQIVQLTIIRHGDALGFMAPKPLEEVYGHSVDELTARVQVALAGKAAEIVYLGTEFTGANSDLQNATRTAASIIGHYGMNGSLYSMGAFGEGPDPRMKRDIERILEDEFKKVKHLLIEYREVAEEIVNRLIAKGDLLGDEIMEIIGDFDRRRAAVAITTSGNGHYLPAPDGNSNGNGHSNGNGLHDAEAYVPQQGEGVAAEQGPEPDVDSPR